MASKFYDCIWRFRNDTFSLKKMKLLKIIPKALFELGGWQLAWTSHEDEEHHPGSKVEVVKWTSHEDEEHHPGKEPGRWGCNILCDCMIADLGALLHSAGATHVLLVILFPLFVHLGDG
ncbi:hypothetical protein HAX54_050411 [Datura stramonium]|uniref:Uncharacterized protein n=1 Tax=Datura stramonium TaxID=4076 RepID=A0ABS8RRA9_DATST|nr:hypothetical protein [Datura stramonium]